MLCLGVPTAALAATGTGKTGAGSAGSGGATSVSPQNLVKAAIAAADKAASVHYVASSTYGNRSITLSGDASGTEGEQHVVLRFGSSVGHVTSRLVGKVIYLRSDKAGLTQYLGMSSSVAAKYAGKWIAFDSSENGFASTASSLTVKAAVKQISITGPFRTTSLAVGGNRAVQVTGTTSSLSSKGSKGAATLVIPSTGTPLPIRYEGRGVQNKKHATATVAYSNWDEALHLTKPKGAIPASSIKP